MKLTLNPKTLVVAALVALSSITTASATNNFPWGWCTYGAAAEFDKYAPAPGCDWGGDAGTWLGNAQAKNWVTYTDTRAAEPHALIVWKNGSMGHVGIVDRVYNDRIRVTEMNWGKQVPGAAVGWTDRAGTYTTRDLKFSENLSTASYKFAGFIMPRKTTAYTADYLLNNQAIADMKALRDTNGNFGTMVSTTVGVDKNWNPDFQLRNAGFNYWVGRINVFHATWKYDPKVRFTNYYEPLTKQWIGWIQVR